MIASVKLLTYSKFVYTFVNCSDMIPGYLPVIDLYRQRTSKDLSGDQI